MSEKVKEALQWGQTVPVKYSYDTLVAGGGIAGVAAALAAARHGARTLLVEREFGLGGLGTLGLIAIYLPINDGAGHCYSQGIARELMDLSIRHGAIVLKRHDLGCPDETLPLDTPIDHRQRLRFHYDPRVYAIELEQLLRQEGVDILYGTDVAGAFTEADRITHVLLQNRDGLSAVKVKTAVDATGDAVLAALSGAETADYQGDNIMASWYESLEDGADHLVYLGLADAEKAEQLSDSIRKFWQVHSAEDISRFTETSHASSLRHFLDKGEVSPAHMMTAMTAVPQIRMTRRLVGAYTQDIDEIFREYEDSVGMFVNWRKAGPAYELPFGCLYGKRFRNLLAAGRCISHTDELWELSRVIPVCAVSGQAAGTAAALGEDFPRMDIKLLQETLRKDGVILHAKELEN